MFTIRVADNFHYMDEDETYTAGEFATWEEALVAARERVDRSLAEAYTPGMTADALFGQYTSFGDDPYIVPTPAGEKFSAWDYARQRSEVICSGG